MPRYDGPIVDVDVHHRAPAEDEVISYMADRWQKYARADPHRTAPLRPTRTVGQHLGPTATARRLDAFTADGEFPGSSYELLCDQVLDAFPYRAAILTHDLGDITFQNPYYGAEVAKAFNDWNVDTWLARDDDRLFSVVAVSTLQPDLAAAEIRRIGAHPKVVAVLLCGNPLGRPFGDPLFHPIYEAAADLGLAVDIHVAGSDGPTGETATAGGPPSSYLEAISGSNQAAGHYISSFIVHGVFEKFPDLKVVIKEYGVAWLPSVVARLDQNYELLRHESPWVKRWPSEYIHDHIRLSTQPIEEGPHRKSDLQQLLRVVDGVEDLLLYSSDYPHWSYDDPRYVSGLLPAAWLERVYYENACETYRLAPAAATRRPNPGIGD